MIGPVALLIVLGLIVGAIFGALGALWLIARGVEYAIMRGLGW